MSTSKVALTVPMYDIMISSDGEVSASCPGANAECLGAAFALARRSPVHDEALIKLTRKINRILTEAGKKGRHRGQNLEMINVGGQILLAWTSSEAAPDATPIRDIDEINRLLGIEPRRPMHDYGKSNNRSHGEASDRLAG